MSKFTIPARPQLPSNQDDLISAPKLDIQRNRIKWTEDGVNEYEHLVSSHLQNIRNQWLEPNSLCSMSILLKMTNTVLTNTAGKTNASTRLDTSFIPKSKRTPRPVLKAKKQLHKVHKRRNIPPKLDETGQPSSGNLVEHRSAKHQYKSAVRRSRVQAGHERDQKLFEILEENPRNIFGFIKSCRKISPTKIESRTVGDKVYNGEAVSDGFYDSMSSIKPATFSISRVTLRLPNTSLTMNTS